jgi:hypothetical protein
LASSLEVQNDLLMGTLVKVLDDSIEEPEQYYLVAHFPEDQTNRSMLFERWLKDDISSLSLLE